MKNIKMIQWWEISLDMRFNQRVLIHSRKLAWIANMIKYLIKKEKNGWMRFIIGFEK